MKNYPISRPIIIQCKHYNKTGFSGLYSKLKKYKLSIYGRSCRKRRSRNIIRYILIDRDHDFLWFEDLKIVINRIIERS